MCHNSMQKSQSSLDKSLYDGDFYVALGDSNSLSFLSLER